MSGETRRIWGAVVSYMCSCLCRYKWYVPLTYVTSSSPQMKSPVIWMKKAGGIIYFIVCAIL